MSDTDHLVALLRGLTIGETIELLRSTQNREALNEIAAGLLEAAELKRRQDQDPPVH
jgi:hypothetical protein